MRPTTRSTQTPAPPTSSCPDCQRVGIIDREQGRCNSTRHASSYGPPLTGYVRYFCPCGARWLADKPEALAHGAWLAKVGLSGLLSPSQDEALVSVPPEPG